MSQANPIRIFVTHAWEEHDDYLRVFEYLESARSFFYRNYSTPDRAPPADKEGLREDLRKQIAPVECVIALASLYQKHHELLEFQLLFAKSANKPVILLRPFGTNRPLQRILTDLADEVLDWEERGLVDAIRRQARHEETTRWDVIEFKLD